ncbi:unnamed protein product [Ectocarpus sp. CCAP 1310/34]|nr:unnamed protein product [Ectocarpus sp. CCAP 1310/34]
MAPSAPFRMVLPCPGCTRGSWVVMTCDIAHRRLELVLVEISSNKATAGRFHVTGTEGGATRIAHRLRCVLPMAQIGEGGEVNSDEGRAGHSDHRGGGGSKGGGMDELPTGGDESAAKVLSVKGEAVTERPRQEGK